MHLKKKFYLFSFWLWLVFLTVLGLSLAVASRGCSLLWCMDFSLQWLLLLQSRGSRRAGSLVVAHELCCSVACGIFLDQQPNHCPLLEGVFLTTRPPGNPNILSQLAISYSDWSDAFTKHHLDRWQ